MRVGWGLIIFGAMWLAIALELLLIVQRASAQERYDPTTDASVQSYLVCIQLASGGGDNSNVPDASQFDEVGYVTWSDGLGKFLLCQVVDK